MECCRGAGEGVAVACIGVGAVEAGEVAEEGGVVVWVVRGVEVGVLGGEFGHEAGYGFGVVGLAWEVWVRWGGDLGHGGGCSWGFVGVGVGGLVGCRD